MTPRKVCTVRFVFFCDENHMTKLLQKRLIGLVQCVLYRLNG